MKSKNKKPIQQLPPEVIQGNIEFLELLKRDAFKGDHIGIDKMIKEMCDQVVNSMGVPEDVLKGGKLNTADEIKERIVESNENIIRRIRSLLKG